MSSRIYLSAPHMGGTELRYIHEAFDTNWISTVGPQIDAFESSLTTYTGTSHAAALASGTAAIHLALRILGVENDDFVLCQSFTFAGSANPILYQGARPVFIDSERESWNMDPNGLEVAIKKLEARSSKPKAIIPVHLYGMPYNVTAIHEIAVKYGIPVIEDAAEALGSTYNQQPCGSFGDFGILSFNGNKIITTSGGGALLSQKREWIDLAKFLATQARDPAPHYEHTTFGYNYRLGNINAAIGIGQMEVLNDRVVRRREIYNVYKEELAQYESIRFLDEPVGVKSNRWLTTVLTDSFEQRERIRLSLEKKDIECRPLWKPMHLQPVFKGAEYVGGSVSEDLFEKGLCLPSGSIMTDGDLERVIKAVKKSISRLSAPPHSPRGEVSARKNAPLGAGGANGEEKGMPTAPPRSPKAETRAREDAPSGAGGAKAEDSGMHYGASGQLFTNAKALRDNETPGEKRLWSRLRKNQLGPKFRRQHPLGNYIADFYCHSIKLVIEVDGEYHNSDEQKKYDESRDQAMVALGIKILRFKNAEIEESIENVLEQIQKEIE